MLKPLLFVVALNFLCAPAFAQDGWASRDYNYASSTMNDFVNRFERNLVNPVARGVRSPHASTKSNPRPALGTTVVAPRRARAPRAMAAAYPVDRRDDAERTFAQLLASFEEIERRFDIPHYDVAGAAAAFMAGNYMGLNHAGFPDRHFPALVEQMRDVIGRDAGFRRASDDEKQDMYEQLAIVGMLMASTQMGLARRPDPASEASMRQAARRYLEAFLKTDAGNVQIGPRGLVLR